MKQRIRVAGIIRTGDGVLVLKRNRGRSEVPVFWEIPTGKILYGEQPEESMIKLIKECLGAEVAEIRLKDVITFLALEGSSQLSNLYIIYDIKLKDGARIYPNDRYNAYKYLKPGNGSGIRLNEASIAALEIETDKSEQTKVGDYRYAANSATVYTDGASRGNPGPSGIGYFIIDENGHVIDRGGDFIGFATSRVAEYYAFRNGINKALEHGFESARFVTDSLMVVNQINGIYSIKNRDTIPIYNEIKELLSRFKSVAVIHVKRSENSAADKEANAAIDRIMKN